MRIVAINQETLDGCGQVDVQLDKSFNVVNSDADGDGSGED